MTICEKFMKNWQYVNKTKKLKISYVIVFPLPLEPTEPLILVSFVLCASVPFCLCAFESLCLVFTHQLPALCQYPGTAAVRQLNLPPCPAVFQESKFCACV